MKLRDLFPSTALVANLVYSRKTFPACPSFSGDLNINEKNIYPESVDFSPSNCKIYVGSLNNGSIVEFDPYTQTSEIIEIPNVTHSEDYFVCGVDYSSATGTIYVSASARAPWFPGFGEDLSGPNRLIHYSPQEKKILWQANIDSVVSGMVKDIGKPFAGFQDSAADKDGNAYFLAAFGNVILKIDKNGKASEFYKPSAASFTSRYGFGGAFVTENNVLVLADGVTQGFVRFDLSSASPSTPLFVAPSGHPKEYKGPLDCDALIAPKRYKETVGICSHVVSRSFSPHGIIAIYIFEDDWKTSKYAGYIPVEFEGPDLWSTAQFGTADRVYALSSALPYDEGVFPQTENTTLVDITEKVDDLVEQAERSGNIHVEL